MKSLDKHKPNNLPLDVRNKVVKPNKPKELESWQIDKKAQEIQDKVGLLFANKSVEKFKPKELDWIEYGTKLIDKHFPKNKEKKRGEALLVFALLTEEHEKELKQLNDSWLYQKANDHDNRIRQDERTELLEEIKTNLPDEYEQRLIEMALECFLKNNNSGADHYSRLVILHKQKEIKNLLNKKDE